MKKYLKLIVVTFVIQAICISMTPSFTMAASKKEHAVKIYNDFLGHTHKLWGYYSAYRTAKTTSQGIKFRLFDINADGIPELLVHDERASNADGQLAIYGVVNGKIKFLSSYAIWEVTLYSNKKGGIYYEYYRGGGAGIYQRFDGKRIKEVQSWYAELNWDTSKLGEKKYYFGKKRVTKRIFDKNKKSMITAKYKIKISENPKNMYSNTPKNRKKYLR